jgi:hypothetical protein
LLCLVGGMADYQGIQKLGSFAIFLDIIVNGYFSLAAVIYQRRKDLDLFTQLGLPPGVPFSDTPPESYFKNSKYYGTHLLSYRGAN